MPQKESTNDVDEELQDFNYYSPVELYREFIPNRSASPRNLLIKDQCASFSFLTTEQEKWHFKCSKPLKLGSDNECSRLQLQHIKSIKKDSGTSVH